MVIRVTTVTQIAERDQIKATSIIVQGEGIIQPHPCYSGAGKKYWRCMVSARSSILFILTQLLAYVTDISTKGGASRDVQTTFIQIEQAT